MSGEDAAFFEQMRSRRDAYRRLADAIHATVGKQHTAYDLGCGVGDVLERLCELGWAGVIGLDASEDAIRLAPQNITISTWDIGRGGGLGLGKADCVICTETAEHIEEQYADRVVDAVCAMARDVIVWSAAQPGQDWPGHVNLKPPSYWMSKFWERGWAPVSLTYKLRHEMREREAQHCHASSNFSVLWRRNA